MNPHSPIWVRIEAALMALAAMSPAAFKEAGSILSAMAKEQAEYDAWVNAEEARYREASGGTAPEKNETATDWLSRMKKEGRLL